MLFFFYTPVTNSPSNSPSKWAFGCIRHWVAQGIPPPSSVPLSFSVSRNRFCLGSGVLGLPSTSPLGFHPLLPGSFVSFLFWCGTLGKRWVFLRPCISENVFILLLHLSDSLAEYKILSWKSFFFFLWNLKTLLFWFSSFQCCSWTGQWHSDSWPFIWDFFFLSGIF